MNALTRKEIRVLTPVWLGTLALAIVPMLLYALNNRGAWVHSIPESRYTLEAQTNFVLFTTYCFGLGAAVLALMPFGHELNARTFSFLLSLPTPRQNIWRAKAVPVGIALLINLALYLGCLRLALHWLNGTGSAPPGWADYGDVLVAAPIAALVAYSGGLWTTVLFRTILGGLGITIVAPFAVLMFEGAIFGKIAPHCADVLVPWTLVAYGIAGIIFARWYFLRAQDIPLGGGANVSLPTAKAKSLRVFSNVRRSNRFVALVQKELQLHQISIFIAGLMLAVHLGSFLLRGLAPRHNASTAWIIINNLWIVWLALPLIIGSVAVAEERRLGTLDGFLTQPVSRSAQITVKFFVAVALAMFFGAVVPWTLEYLWQLVGPISDLMSSVGLADLLKTALIVVLCAFFASTTTRHTIEAVCLGGVLVPLIFVGLQFLSGNHFVGDAHIPRYGLLTWYIVLPIFLCPTIWLAWKNSQRTQVRAANLISTLGILILSICTAWGAAKFTLNRGWEYFMSVEPKHGQPILHMGDHAKVVAAGKHAYALLPDGRLWVAQIRFDVRYEGLDDVRRDRHDHVVGASLASASFLPGSNWVDLAYGREPFAIKSDGTLWQLAPGHLATNANNKRFWAVDPLRQFGTDSDWASLSAGESFVLALKRDGSLWGCGNNLSGQLGPGPIVNFKTFIPVWSEARWTKVFASSHYCLGVKTDGTTWTWGDEIGYAARQTIPDYELKRSEFTGTNWTSFTGERGELALATRDDNSLWIFVPNNISGPLWTIFGESIEKPGLHQLGNKRDWQTLTATHPTCALKTDGTWLVNNALLGTRETTRISRHSDWVAINSKQMNFIGLAADGTISCWMPLDTYPYYFGSSRRPTWSTNIFATR